ncbi:MAG: Holliday junction resolvase RuvX [Candidatus Eisenbacteria bacterium]|uniref:Putative pre-16S rRNA nuclease n=1 Tax=Eiseniibacteriota bacterium TaxID=2212470 RepID=A0A538TP34_UNCEI|nr:MAG: Holliday junction resolvase RuvX [Candidatus Eisenbacteria bacterium]
MRVLGVDFGLRQLGLALSDSDGSLATPLRSLRLSTVRDAPAAVAAVALEVEAAAVVVGVPLGLEGEESRPEVRRVERFAKALRKESGLPVHLIDESLSSREAEERSGRGDRGARARRAASGDAVHAAAAAVILQRWLDRPRTRRGEERP